MTKYLGQQRKKPFLPIFPQLKKTVWQFKSLLDNSTTVNFVKNKTVKKFFSWMPFKQLKNKFYFRKVFSFALSIKNFIFILKKFETLKKIGNFFRKASLTFFQLLDISSGQTHQRQISNKKSIFRSTFFSIKSSFFSL